MSLPPPASTGSETENTVVPVLSIVSPMWNEADNVHRFVNRVTATLEKLAMSYEIVIANDGSADDTGARLQEALQSVKRWRVVNLSRNFGQQAAYLAGLQHAAGEAVIFLDADLQDPPEVIPEMMEKWRQGAKLVVGCRRSRPERGVRGMLLRGFHHLFARLTKDVMPKDSGTFALMDRVIVDRLCSLPELNLFLPALRSWIGFRREIVWYDREERVGAPKQSYSKLFNYAWDGITSFSDVPLKLISWVGFVVCFLSLAYGGALLCIRFLQIFGVLATLEVPGFSTVAIAVFFLGGVHLLSLGVIGEYQARIYREVKRRPHFIVESVIASSPE